MKLEVGKTYKTFTKGPVEIVGKFHDEYQQQDPYLGIFRNDQGRITGTSRYTEDGESSIGSAYDIAPPPPIGRWIVWYQKKSGGEPVMHHYTTEEALRKQLALMSTSHIQLTKPRFIALQDECKWEEE